MDVLSEVLKAVKLDGAVFFHGEFSAPWCVRQPDGCSMASYLSTASSHVIIFHLLTEGRGYARTAENGRPVSLLPGDVVMFPHGDAHLMGNGSPVTPVDTGEQLQQVLAQGKMVSQFGGGGEMTRLICGYMTCDSQLCQMFLSGLPPCSSSTFATPRPGNGWRTRCAIRSKTPRLPAQEVLRSLRNYPKRYLRTPFGATSRCYRPPTRAGLPEYEILTWDRPWRSCTSNRLIPGRLLRWRMQWGYRVQCSPIDFGIICRTRRWGT